MLASRRLLHQFRAGLPWLVWLVLLLPLAQWAGMVHAYGHVVQQGADGQRGSPQESGAPAHTAPCDICLSLSALGHGGPAHAAESPGLSVGRLASPAALAAGVWAGRPRLAYLSRAPPATPG